MKRVDRPRDCRRGSFTEPSEIAKDGWKPAPLWGSVFLNELGEMDLAIQSKAATRDGVKLLRVMETRSFSAVGDTLAREFHGKPIVATDHDLPAEIRARRFREDLYYRLCADLIQTPLPRGSNSRVTARAARVAALHDPASGGR
jgi:transcriptional regulator with PAS, ATPase and Fis domain